METTTPNDYPFLKGGGELGELTRNFNWSDTSLGSPDQWPQSLRTTLSIILSSRFPMFLFWGPQHLCFYNDAYRPSLGRRGKHPEALGKPGAEVWPEIWADIKPLIDQVLSGGEATWSEDQLIPIDRNGQIEAVYWTFSYSAVRDETGQIAGVFVTCTETTQKVITLNQLTQSKEELQFAIEAAELGTWDLNLLTNTFRANARLKEWTNLQPDEKILLSSITDAIAPKDRQRVMEAMDQALCYESGGQYDISYTIIHPKTQQERLVRAKGKAWFDENQLPYRFNGTLQDVTEQTRAEEEKHKLIAILDASHEFVGLAGVDTSIQYVNPAARAMLGWNSQDGRRIQDCIYPEDWPLAENVLAELLEKGYSSEEIRFVNVETGEPFWLEWNSVVLKDPQSDEIIGLATVSPNINQRKQTEQALTESEQRLRSLVDSAPFPIGVYVGREMRIQFANQSIIDVWGKGQNVIGQRYAELLPELENQSIYGELDEVFTTGVAFHARNQRVDIVVDGRLQPYYFNYSFTPLFDGHGQVYGVMNTAAEITDLILAKQKVEEVGIVLQGAIELAELATWSLDISNNTFSYSKRFMAWLGFSESTKGLDDAYNPLPDEYRQSVVAAIAEAIQPGSSGFYEHEHPIINRLTGQIRIIHAQAQVLYDPDRKPVLLSGTAQDVTQQRQIQLTLEQQVQERTEELEAINEEFAATNEELAAANEELLATNNEFTAANRALEEANRDLARSNQNLEQFAYIASHDLQEPLRKIQQFGDLLKTQYMNELDGGITYLERMQSAASRMSMLIKDLLVFSRISTGQAMAVPVPLMRVINQALENVSTAIEEANADIEIGTLPTVQGDELQLSQLFQNLLSNAIKFRRVEPSGVPVKPRIIIEATQVRLIDLPTSIRPTRYASAYHQISVSDNGIGFDEKYVDRIFQVFQRLHGKNEFAGTGVGLAICEKVAVNHGGGIMATSQPGQGATFYVYLPV